MLAGPLQKRHFCTHVSPSQAAAGPAVRQMTTGPPRRRAALRPGRRRPPDPPARPTRPCAPASGPLASDAASRHATPRPLQDDDLFLFGAPPASGPGRPRKTEEQDVDEGSGFAGLAGPSLAALASRTASPTPLRPATPEQCSAPAAASACVVEGRPPGAQPRIGPRGWPTFRALGRAGAAGLESLQHLLEA